MRSRVNKAVNLNSVFCSWGGGGHPKAAACTVKLHPQESGAKKEGESVEAQETSSSSGKAVQDLLDILVAKVKDQHARPVLTAGDCMTAPVLTCNADDPIDRAEKVWGVDGCSKDTAAYPSFMHECLCFSSWTQKLRILRDLFTVCFVFPFGTCDVTKQP